MDNSTSPESPTPEASEESFGPDMAISNTLNRIRQHLHANPAQSPPEPPSTDPFPMEAKISAAYDRWDNGPFVTLLDFDKVEFILCLIQAESERFTKIPGPKGPDGDDQRRFFIAFFWKTFGEISEIAMEEYPKARMLGHAFEILDGEIKHLRDVLEAMNFLVEARPALKGMLDRLDNEGYGAESDGGDGAEDDKGDDAEDNEGRVAQEQEQEQEQAFI